MLKTLLKCPNRFVSADYIRSKISTNDRIMSFGLCGGYIEMDLFEKGYDISIYTNRYWTYEFWRCLANSPHDLIRAIEYYNKRFSTQDIAQYRERWYEHFEDPYDRAAIYYLLNRYSKSGSLYDIDFTKHNFSHMTLSCLKRDAMNAQELKLKYIQEENPLDIFKKTTKEAIILLPIGAYKTTYMLQKKTQAIDAPSYDYEDLKNYLSENNHRMIVVHKYNLRADEFYDNKTYINKLGVVTDNPELAEDLIVSNF